ncbi:two-component system response regulator YesN [Paenibacillus sp. PastF-3]|uniref:response regulator n=1 Tax=Paenibacillus sp. PastF-3 TaxID=2940626 RepID=UPI0024743F3E|nr:response regulator [Paenibacillus sp. PastF-3]MDH6368352.1 two-component system response regulator YesN [Paenibacillus sp. PastF-3]
MYKLMIVEDEPLIRTGLKHYFAWEELGVHNIIEAENGKEGIATALREKPDLVITDIRMPEMDGLQMIEQIRDLLPDTLFIILTGFNDFQYAQKAIQLGNVHAFLLKPLEYEESLLIIQKCINKLQLKRQDRLKRSTLEGAQFVKLLLEEEDAVIDDALIHKLCNFNSNYYLYLPFVLTGIPMRENVEKFIHNAVGEYLLATTPHSIFTYSLKTKLYGLIVLGSPSSTDNFPLQAQVQTRIDQYLKALTLEHHLGLYLVIGKTTENPAQINTLLHESDRMLYQRFYKRDCRLFYVPQWIENSNSMKPSLIQLDENDKKRMISCIESANEQETLQLMHRLAQDILSKTDVSSPDYWLAFLHETLSVIIRFANKNHIHIEGVYSEKLLNLTFVDDFDSLETLFDWLGRWMIHLGIVYTEGLTHNHQQDVIIFEHIKSFIKENIDQDVTLQMVADRFFYNPSYLSRLFKRKLDKNYMRFVTEIRMEYAQECLKKPEILVTDVCTMCGYKSYKHFVKTFRSITNMTPSDYRKQSGW